MSKIIHLAHYWQRTKPQRYMTPDGPGVVEDYDGAVPLTEQRARGKIAVRLDKAVHESGRTVEYYPVEQLKEV